MDKLHLNKFAGAVLAVGVAVIGMHEISSRMFEPEPLTRDQGCIDFPPSARTRPVVEVDPRLSDWNYRLSQADLSAGEQLFNRCASCHKPDGNDQGPFLESVMGRRPGSAAGFSDYSDAMHAFGAEHPQWTFNTVYEFIENPRRYLPGTNMTFAGLRDEQSRINLIAYLNQWGSGLPVPQPGEAALPEANSLGSDFYDCVVF